MKKWLFLLLAFLFLIFPSTLYSADLDVICSDSECSPSHLSEFFPSAEVWFPGKEVKKSLRVINNSSVLRSVSVRAVNYYTQGSFDQYFDFFISRKVSGSGIWSGTLSEFYSLNILNLNDLNHGEEAEYIFTSKMHDMAGDEYQGRSTGFDLVIRVVETDAEEEAPTTTPTPEDSDTSDDTDDDSDDSSGLGSDSGSSNSEAGESGSIPVPEDQNILQRLNLVFGQVLLTEAGYTQEFQEEGEVLGVFSSTEQIEASGLMCVQPWWGYLVSIIQGLLTAFFILRQRKNSNKFNLGGIVLITIAGILVVYYLFCSEVMLFVSMFVGVVGICVLIVYERKKSIRGEYYKRYFNSISDESFFSKI